MNLTAKDLARYFDATNLALDSSASAIQSLCEEALINEYAAVCLYPKYIDLAARVLNGSNVNVATVIGFPHGRSHSKSKEAEIIHAASAGVNEVDIVMDYCEFREKGALAVAHEIKDLAEVSQKEGLLSKIIVETCFLNKGQILDALHLCEDAAVDYIKTSTGFASGGANVEHIRLWNEHRKHIKIKASGGIRSLQDACQMIEAGADRLGLSVAQAILNEV